MMSDAVAKTRKEKRIVFVHGRGEKPRREIERAIAFQALQRGIARGIELEIPQTAPQVRLAEKDFHVAYFADVLSKVFEPDEEYTEALATLAKRPTAAFTREAYLEEQARWRFRAWRDEAFAALGSYAASYGGARRVISKFAPELITYCEEPALRARIHAILAAACSADPSRVPSKAIKTAPQVLLVAHSLGSVFALDALLANVLRDVEITLVTLGSPLADACVREFFQTLRHASNAAPVQRWINIAAEDDHVCYAQTLAAHYRCANGQAIEDRLCENFFIHPTYGPNAHKSYGYLDHPMMGAIALEFLRA
jgi:hypothetical protein